MIARGPDGKGEWLNKDGRVGLGHRRLSIIDLTDAGSQPMVDASGNLIVAFNGEIYNYPELRRELEAKGQHFRSDSDTEVLLHLYALKGANMVRHLRGMFAFAIWDRLRRCFFIARDPYGIKPIYYSDDGQTFRFASQVKALLAGRALETDVDPAGLVGFFLFGSVPEPFTTYRAMKTLPAGCFLIVDEDEGVKLHRYYSIAEAYVEAEGFETKRLPDIERHAMLREALLDSVTHHLLADVPVGAFLSAGVDSGALVGLMRDAGQQNIQTVTLSFEEFTGSANDEAPLAAEIARMYGAIHTTRVVGRAEFLNDLPRIFDAMDQPSIDGINTWFVSKAAYELGLKVAISGVGGDELFGGYPSFGDIPRSVSLLAIPSAIPYLGDIFRKGIIAANPVRFGLSPKFAGLVEYGGDYAGAWLLRRGVYMPWELEKVLAPEVVEDGLKRLVPKSMIKDALVPEPTDSFARVATLESTLYMRNQLLRDSDWASMAHSLEVRTPLVDVELLRKVIALRATNKSAYSKDDLGHAPAKPLPASVIKRPKTGFGMPIAAWLTSETASTKEPLHSAYGYARIWAQEVAAKWLAV
jgi:asparagine synthase (glutamine-hydrolysing)